MTYYGPSPFYWDWIDKTDKTPTAGDFCFSSHLAKTFSVFYVNSKLEDDDDNCFHMIYENVTMVVIPVKDKARIIKMILSGNLPVLSKNVAFSTNLQTLLKVYQQHNCGSTTKLDILRFDSKPRNENILSLWLDKPLDKSSNKQTVLCFFHDDHTPSAVYYFHSGLFKCFVCSKKCYNLFLNLKLIHHPILNRL